jgi:hypothetical protein
MLTLWFQACLFVACLVLLAYLVDGAVLDLGFDVFAEWLVSGH